MCALLYKIDSILLGSNGGHRLEMTMEVALVEKTAFKSGVRNVPAFPQQLFCLLYTAVHAVGMRGDSRNILKLPDKGIGGGCKVFSQSVER